MLFSRIVTKGLAEEDSETTIREKQLTVLITYAFLTVAVISTGMAQVWVRWYFCGTIATYILALASYYRSKCHRVLRHSLALTLVLFAPFAWISSGCAFNFFVPLTGFTGSLINVLTGAQRSKHIYGICHCIVMVTLISISANGEVHSHCPTQPKTFTTTERTISALIAVLVPFICSHVSCAYVMRHAEIYSAMLMQAKNESDESAQAKMMFLANMSHEIRTPLNGIIATLPLFQRTALSTEQQELLDLITPSASHLLLLLNDILDFAKLESGGVDLERSQVNLQKEALDTLEVLHVTAAKKNIDVSVYAAPSLPLCVMGDAVRLKQILYNLLSNAIKFTPQGGLVNVTLRCDHTENEACSQSMNSSRASLDTNHTSGVHVSSEEAIAFINVVVTDTGIGIAPEKLSMLFGRFQQIDSSTTREFGGTGLGLAIVQQLSDLMDGHVSVESLEGLGTRFVVQLPLPLWPSDFDEQSITVENLALDKRLAAAVLRPRGRAKIKEWRCPSTLDVIQMLCADWDVQCTSLSGDAPPPRQIVQGTRLVAFMMSVHLDEPTFFESAQQLLRLSALANAEAPTIVLLQSSRDPAVSESARHRTVSLFPSCRILQHFLPLKPLDVRQIMHNTNSAVTHQSQRLSTPAPQPPGPSPAELIPSFMRLLVAEDNLINQQVLGRILSNEGLQHIIVPTGVEAVRDYKKNYRAIALILMDLSMPQMDGYEATRLIRDFERYLNLPRVPIVALTAHGFAVDKERCLEAGMDAYLTKPYTQSILMDVVARMLAAVGRCESSYGHSTPPCDPPSSTDVFDHSGLRSIAEIPQPPSVASLSSASRLLSEPPADLPGGLSPFKAGEADSDFELESPTSHLRERRTESFIPSPHSHRTLDSPAARFRID